MPLNIHGDLGRFREIVKGRVRRDLRRFMGSGEIKGNSGNGRTFSVPLPHIALPRLTYGKNGGGIGQGDGGKGDAVDGAGHEAGEGTSQHAVELEVSLEELTDIMVAELGLPPLLPKGQHEVATERTRYNSIAPVGPNALRHGRRTFGRALLREMAAGTYDPAHPIVIPQKADMRFRSGRPSLQPMAAACAVYIMDVSGSMDTHQKEMARQTSFWINLWLRRNFPRMKTIYIIHDSVARRVDESAFFSTREGGGTLISSAYKLMLELMPIEFSPDDWNIFVFQFSDGDNWTTADTGLCLELLDGVILQHVNRFGYGQVNSQYGTGQFYHDLRAHFRDDDKVRITEIPDRDKVMTAIKALLG